jgi:hypothetical protein
MYLPVNVTLCLCLCADDALRLEAWCHRTSRVPLLPPTQQQRAPDSDYRQAAFCIRCGLFPQHMNRMHQNGANQSLHSGKRKLTFHTCLYALHVATHLSALQCCFQRASSTRLQFLYQHISCLVCRCCCCCSLPVSPDLSRPQWMTCHTDQVFADINTGELQHVTMCMRRTHPAPLIPGAGHEGGSLQCSTESVEPPWHVAVACMPHRAP